MLDAESGAGCQQRNESEVVNVDGDAAGNKNRLSRLYCFRSVQAGAQVNCGGALRRIRGESGMVVPISGFMILVSMVGRTMKMSPFF
jgi:hypothetical protein